MCSISGLIAFSKIKNAKSVEDKIKQIIVKAEDRGRDSCGITTVDINKKVKNYRHIGKASEFVPELSFIKRNTKVVINNNRAEPTTEFIKKKKKTDVQPYESVSNITVHNGTIANDKELREEFNIQNSETKIDSIVIPYSFDNIKDDNDVIKVLQDKLLGSYALCNYDVNRNLVYLATNYKPIHLQYSKTENILYFSSLEQYFGVDKKYESLQNSEPVIELKPYTLLVINPENGEIREYDLYKNNTDKKKALIIASAGLDSTVAAKWAQVQGYEIGLLHFNYGCIAEQKEDDAIKKIAENLNAPLFEINIDFYKDVIHGSNIIGENTKINKNNEEGAELAIEWVPARNLVFFSIAAAFAEAQNYDYLVLGGNLEESGAFADNEYIFQKKFNDLLPNSLNLQHKVEVLTPLANLMKKEIVELGIKTDAPLDLTWSCYDSKEKHCGECGPCMMRRTAFKMLGYKDMIEYLNVPKNFWKDLKEYKQ